MAISGGSSHESENNPKEDPLMLWLTGGPGCSAFSGLVIEIGNTNSVSSIIFVDLPVSTGFTYATTEFATQRRTGY
ncbi:Serine carboxypeptidase-like 15 [Glycine soja]|uniref:Serine carboxypeptidase-like 15 n=1 Tax=Glycine soja TaxID=3848 RepID=A0A0B2QSE0_GLYSO|nr:Serine carboxypeptidase-like 15 [Glycine soja]